MDQGGGGGGGGDGVRWSVANCIIDLWRQLYGLYVVYHLTDVYQLDFDGQSTWKSSLSESSLGIILYYYQQELTIDFLQFSKNTSDWAKIPYTRLKS